MAKPAAPFRSGRRKKRRGANSANPANKDKDNNGNKDKDNNENKDKDINDDAVAEEKTEAESEENVAKKSAVCQEDEQTKAGKSVTDSAKKNGDEKRKEKEENTNKKMEGKYIFHASKSGAGWQPENCKVESRSDGPARNRSYS